MNEIIELTPELKKDISQLETMAIQVSSQNERNELVSLVKSAKSTKAKIVEFFKESKEAAHKAWKAIIANEKRFTDRLDEFEGRAKKEIIRFDRIEEEKAEKERARLQALEDEKFRKEQERLLKKAENIKSPERKEALLEEASTISAPVVQVETTEKVKGESKQVIWKGRVVDLSKVPDQFKMIDQKAVDGYARATKGQIPVSGLEFYPESIIKLRSV